MGEHFGSYLAYIGCGYAVWYMISSTIINSSDLFDTEKDYITQINIPISVYILKLLSRNLIIFGHNFIVCIALILVFNPINFYTLLFIPGLILLLINLYWVALVISMLGARYRDIPPIINSVIQVLFLASPIAWKADKLGPDSKIILLNQLVMR